MGETKNEEIIIRYPLSDPCFGMLSHDSDGI
jgi:hypothetical protein